MLKIGGVAVAEDIRHQLAVGTALAINKYSIPITKKQNIEKFCSRIFEAQEFIQTVVAKPFVLTLEFSRKKDRLNQLLLALHSDFDDDLLQDALDLID